MKTLILCNTSYQLLVAMWIKYKYLKNSEVDLIITDHFKDSIHLTKNIKKYGFFNDVYYAETLMVSRNNISYSKKEQVLHLVFPKKYLKDFVPIKKIYNALYIANFDSFSQILYNALIHTNSSMKLFVYEEGLSTYSSFEKYYTENKDYYGTPKNYFMKIVHRLLYRPKTIYGNVEKFYMFNPGLIKWNPNCPILKMDKISCSDAVFKQDVNKIFGYNSQLNEYTTKYIFFEESFLAEGTEINDIELVDKISEHIGKENIMIKIHPRNPINRFAKKGYRTNKYTYIPWEVVLMNMEDLSDKVFITVASACVLNPFLTFDKEVRAYSLFYCIDYVPPILQNGLWDFVAEMFKQYSDKIQICSTIEEVQ